MAAISRHLARGFDKQTESIGELKNYPSELVDISVHKELSMSRGVRNFKRYVDDFGQSTTGQAATKDLMDKTDKVLKRISMEVKGWVESGKDPPEVATEDGVSAGFAGLTWFPKADFYKLNIQSLHFGKKKRGKGGKRTKKERRGILHDSMQVPPPLPTEPVLDKGKREIESSIDNRHIL